MNVAFSSYLIICGVIWSTFIILGARDMQTFGPRTNMLVGVLVTVLCAMGGGLIGIGIYQLVYY